MHASALIPFLDPTNLVGSWGLIGVCIIIFAETGLLIGFVLPGDTLLVITGILTLQGTITLNIWLVGLIVGLSAFLGGELGYLIGRRVGPRIFERRESGFFSKANISRTDSFFERFGGAAVIVARFVPVVRTFAPIAAGVGHMKYRKYSLYNFIGALAWGGGMTFLGFGIGKIPPVRNFVTDYIDLILLGAVAIAVVPTVIHTVHAAAKARKLRQEEEDAGSASQESAGAQNA